MEKQNSGDYVIGRFLGLMIALLVFAWPLKALVNYTLSPALLGLLFGGYLTYWKSMTLMAAIRLIR